MIHMIHMSYDYALVTGSVVAAVITCYVAISLQELIFSNSNLSRKKTLLFFSGLVLGFAIWVMHFVGMLACHLPEGYKFSPSVTFFSYVIGAAASIFAVWLTTRETLPLSRLVLGSFVMGIGISGMHYTGMAAASFHTIQESISAMAVQEGPGLMLFVIIAITCLILVASFAVAILELRLEDRNLQLLRVNKELESLALQDNLTKLPNRLFLIDYTTSLFSLYKFSNKKIAFIYIDLDRFKAVNDAFGHHIGDELLVKLAQRLHALLEPDQKLIRIGGDEFLMVLEDFKSERIEAVADEILKNIQDGFNVAGKDINVSASLGVVYYPDHGTNLHDLLINADAAMLQSKEQGRNTFSIFNYSLDQQEIARSQSKLINDLYKAVEEQQFVLFYQPKFTADLKICGVEALIRWKHPSLGLLAPNMFIEGAEQTGLIIKMGYWALEQACKQLQLWTAQGRAFAPIAVNLSAVQFEHKQLIDTLANLIKKYNVDPNHLIIEITESTAMHHIDVSIRTFENLRNLGISLAIDDFGTGHSSFLYLKDLPVDELKIDREFIRNLSVGSKDEIILRSIIELAKRLGLVVTAEGVETQQQADILKSLGCQQFQGYLLGMPLPVDRLESTFENV